jgi:formylglycine-generating enzyme required for sulfatase activity
VGSGSESCCTSLEVTPNGPYYRTYANSGSGPSGEADPATVSAFRLDKYLVTVGRFRQFVNAVLPPDGGTG